MHATQEGWNSPDRPLQKKTSKNGDKIMVISQETHTCSFRYSGFLCSPDAKCTGSILKSSTCFSNKVANTRKVQVELATPTTVKPMATDHSRLLTTIPAASDRCPEDANETEVR